MNPQHSLLERPLVHRGLLGQTILDVIKIPGATKQLSYIKALGADAVLLSSLSAKSTDCSKPGITDLAGIDQRYGNLDHFNGILEKAKKLGELFLLLTNKVV